MGQHTTKQNLKLKKSLKSGRFFLTPKKSYKDYFHWESKDPDTCTEPYIQLTEKQLRRANKKRLQSAFIFFILFGLLAGAILAFWAWGW